MRSPREQDALSPWGRCVLAVGKTSSPHDQDAFAPRPRCRPLANKTMVGREGIVLAPRSHCFFPGEKRTHASLPRGGAGRPRSTKSYAVSIATLVSVRSDAFVTASRNGRIVGGEVGGLSMRKAQQRRGVGVLGIAATVTLRLFPSRPTRVRWRALPQGRSSLTVPRALRASVTGWHASNGGSRTGAP
jgi:hypothetical protein